jgi:uncharacterized protein YdbL (DUF1318 family)
MNKLLSTIILSLLIMSQGPAFAARPPLAQALNSKKVCEKVDGFIQATPGNENETNQLVESVNAERATVYADIARKEGLDPSVVAAEHAKEIRARTPSWACK